MSTFGARTSRIARKPVSSGRRKSECHHQNTPDLLRPWPHPEIPHRALRALLFHARPRPAAPGEAHAPLLYHQGVLLGYFDIEEVVQNVGQLPKLTTLDG